MTGMWLAVPTATPGYSSTLRDVAAISPTDGWAVGYYSDGVDKQTLIEHWDGTSWTQVPSPSPGGANGSRLYGVTATSASNAWAVGEYFDGVALRTMVLHWNGTGWKRPKSPDPGYPLPSTLYDVAAVSSTRAWRVGSYTGPLGSTQTLAEAWGGSSWQQVPSPDPGG